MKKEDLIRAATILDCKGSVGIYRIKGYKLSSKGKPYFYYRPQIQVVNSNKPYLERYFVKVFNIGRVTKTTSTKKQLWKWAVYCRQALIVCKILLPYLILKKSKILEIIEFYRKKDKLK